MAKKVKPLEEGDAIGSVLDGRRLVRVERVPVRNEDPTSPMMLVFRGTCGISYGARAASSTASTRRSSPAQRKGAGTCRGFWTSEILDVPASSW